jgi:hypothetical protein
MKTQAEVERAIKLLTLALTDQVKLRRPWRKETQQQSLAVCRALMWVIDIKNPLPMDEMLKELESLVDDPGYNPHQSVSE